MIYKEQYKNFVLEQDDIKLILNYINIFGGRFGLFRYDLLLNDLKNIFKIKNHKIKLDELITLGLLLTITMKKEKYVYMNSKSYGTITNIEKGIKVTTPNSLSSYDLWNLKYKTYRRINNNNIQLLMNNTLFQNFTNTKVNLENIKKLFSIKDENTNKYFDNKINFFKASNVIFWGNKGKLIFHCLFIDTENSFWYDTLKRNFDKIIQEIIDFTNFLETNDKQIYIMIEEKNKTAFEKIHKPLITDKKNYIYNNQIIKFMYV